jgi:hypothetical protein
MVAFLRKGDWYPHQQCDYARLNAILGAVLLAADKVGKQSIAFKLTPPNEEFVHTARRPKHFFR